MEKKGFNFEKHFIAYAGIGAGAVDETTGKAFYGTPGPGSYLAPSLWNNIPTAAEARTGVHVFPRAPHFTAQGRTEIVNHEADVSPGPVKFSPKYTWVDPKEHQAPFGSSTRDTESRRFISRSLDASAGHDSPGPGTYRCVNSF